MDMTLIKKNAPTGAKFWSPAVMQYFDERYLNMAFLAEGKMIQVEREFRHELIALD